MGARENLSLREQSFSTVTQLCHGDWGYYGHVRCIGLASEHKLDLTQGVPNSSDMAGVLIDIHCWQVF